MSGIEGRWESGEVFFDFTSYTLPRATYRADLAAGAVEPFWRPRVPFDPEAFETRQVWFPSKDGTRVPMFIVHRKGLAVDGQRPTLLYGYGGFNVSITPHFSAFVAWWLEQGGVYAVANLRGGAEFGEAWHRAGMLEKKQNVFDDFIAAVRVADRQPVHQREPTGDPGCQQRRPAGGRRAHPTPRSLPGRSVRVPRPGHGRLLPLPEQQPARAARVRRCLEARAVPFSLRLFAVPEGHARNRYPAVLFTTGDADTRVPPLQARKMTARLQAATTSGWPVLLLYDTKAGHAGGRPIGKIVEDESLELAFLVQQLGMEPTR